MKILIKTSEGFTLLEIMIALMVFAILSSITASAMYHAFDTRARVNRQANQLNVIQLALTLIARDTEQIVERSVNGENMRVFPPFVGEGNYVEFTRGGLVNPNGVIARSTLIRIAYVCKGKKLIRRTWDRLDSPSRSSYQDRIIFENLDACKFAYLAKNQQVLPEWREYAIQQNQKKETLPTAIQFSLTVNGWGNMSLLFPIPEALYAA